jgi:mycothiol synthase
VNSHVRSAATFPAAAVPHIESLVEQAQEADGAAPFSDDMWRLVIEGRTAHAAYVTSGDDVIAAAFTGLQGDRVAGELLVHPSHRRLGHGTVLARDLLASGEEEMWLWSHSDHPGAQALAKRLGLEKARALLQLRLEDIDAVRLPEITWPAGVTVRPFIVGRDEGAWLEVNNAAFAWHPEQGRQTLDDIRAATTASDFDPNGFFLAFRGDELLGFHWTKVHPSDPSPPPGTDSDQPIGEVYVVGVSPAAHGQGLGTALTATGLHYLADSRGVRTVMLYVESDNPAALKVYERLGFRRYLTNVAYRRAER